MDRALQMAAAVSLNISWRLFYFILACSALLRKFVGETIHRGQWKEKNRELWRAEQSRLTDSCPGLSSLGFRMPLPSENPSFLTLGGLYDNRLHHKRARLPSRPRTVLLEQHPVFSLKEMKEVSSTSSSSQHLSKNQTKSHRRHSKLSL